MPASPLFSRLPRGRRLLLLAAVIALGWIAFFDSHSLIRRAQYTLELRQLQEENARLAEENADLARRVNAGLSDATVEKVAREQYGMRRPGETVYRVEDGD